MIVRGNWIGDKIVFPAYVQIPGCDGQPIDMQVDTAASNTILPKLFFPGLAKSKHIFPNAMRIHTLFGWIMADYVDKCKVTILDSVTLKNKLEIKDISLNFIDTLRFNKSQRKQLTNIFGCEYPESVGPPICLMGKDILCRYSLFLPKPKLRIKPKPHEKPAIFDEKTTIALSDEDDAYDEVAWRN